MPSIFEENIQKKVKKNCLYFIGAGPGDIEYLTISSLKVLIEADVVIYSGSLLDLKELKDLFDYRSQRFDFLSVKIREALAGKDVEFFNAIEISREKILSIIEEKYQQGLTIARLFSGDLCFFSTLNDHVSFCDANGINYEVLPGVSTHSALAAKLAVELTIPGLCQSFAVVRAGKGGSLVPESEKIENFANTNTTLVVYLVGKYFEEIIARVSPFYSSSSGVVFAVNISCNSEIIIRSNLANFLDEVKAYPRELLKNRAILVVSNVLDKKLVDDFTGKKSQTNLYSGWIKNFEM